MFEKVRITSKKVVKKTSVPIACFGIGVGVTAIYVIYRNQVMLTAWNTAAFKNDRILDSFLEHDLYDAFTKYNHIRGN